jgi:predicted GNAT family acetyltransferase
VGRAEEVTELWRLLQPFWGPARAVRARQPLLEITQPDAAVPPDPLVRRVAMEDFPLLYPACVAMFTEEVGVAPDAGTIDGDVLYRSRTEELVRSGRSFARIEDGRVVFKAEVGAVTPEACQIQGVWVHPEMRGRGYAAPGMAAVVRAALRDIAPRVSLYVNDFNLPARATYRKVGFRQVDTCMSVLF